MHRAIWDLVARGYINRLPFRARGIEVLKSARSDPTPPDYYRFDDGAKALVRLETP